MSELSLISTELNLGAYSGIASAAKYNPHLWSPEELRAIFVARQRELATILQALHAAPTDAPQHLLITGQRGMGKSTLLRRVALAVEDDADLSSIWLPLRFPEEQYTVSTPAELWANVIGALADALETQGRNTVDVDEEILRLSNMSSVNGEEEALKWLHQWCIDNKLRLLLLIDSTDLLFSNLSGSDAHKRGKQSGGASALWRVRKTLLHSPHFFWLGGSYQPLEANGLYDDAFLDFFQLIELRPLSILEMQSAIQAMARIFGAGRGLKGDDAEIEVKRMLDARPERLRAMRQLTGGNPRTTVMLYELFAAGGRDNLRADLERLLDSMTPLYKSKLEVLADQPRKILAHVMEHWAPITAKALAQAATLSSSTISAQLSRLEQEGLIERTALSGTKRYGYQCGERFFNIWYLMRNAPRGTRARVGWLVEFMRLWYSNDELQGMARIRCGIHREGLLCDGSELEYSRAIARAMPTDAQDRHVLEWTVFLQARKEPFYKEIFEIDGDDADYSSPDIYLSRFEALNYKLVNARSIKDKQLWTHQVKSALHLSLVEKEDIAEKCGHLSADELSGIQLDLSKKRTKLLENYKLESLEFVEAAVLSGKFFPDCPDSQRAYTQMMGCFADNSDAFILALWCLVRRRKDPVVEVVCKKAIELGPTSALPWYYLGNFLISQQDMLDCAEDAYSKATELDPKWAMPWSALARLWGGKSDRVEDAELAARRSVELDPKNPICWMTLGYLLTYKLQRLKDAENAFREAIKIDSSIALVWHCLGDLLSLLTRFDEAEISYRKAIELDSTWALPWCDLARLFRFKLNRFKEAEDAYLKAIKLKPKDAKLYDDLGDLMSELKRFEEAEKAYRKAIELDSKWAVPWNDLSYLLGYELNRLEEAEEILRKAIEIDINSPMLWDSLGSLLFYKLDRREEAEFAFRKAIDLDASFAGPWGRLGDVLGEDSCRLDEAEKAYLKAVELDPNWQSPVCALGNLLGFKFNRLEEAEGVYRQAIEVSPKSARLWNELGHLLEVKFGRFNEAEIAYKKAGEFEPEWVLPWINLGELLESKLNRLNEAEISYKKAIELDPHCDWAWYLLGDLFANKMNRLEEAEIAYRNAIEINPNIITFQIGLGNFFQDQVKRYDDAENIYRAALCINEQSAISVANLARLLAKVGRHEEANSLYRESLRFAEDDDQNLKLQAHCWLGNRDLAMQSLDKLAGLAINNDSDAFFQLKEQCFECHVIGLANCLIDLMEKSRFANFLLPFSLALRVVNGDKNALLDVAVEVRGMAEDIVKQIME